MSDQKKNGEFCWNELATSDAAKCTRFYEGLFGWKANSMSMGKGETYTMFEKDGQQLAGMRVLSPQEAGVPSHWACYVAVDEVELSCEKAAGLGGQVIVPPTDVPNIGRFAFIKDPAGAVVALWKSHRTL